MTTVVETRTPTGEVRACVLIVDDLPEKRLVYQTVLQDLGDDLVLAASGAEALGHVLRQEFAVILLDVNMPGMDGFETARLIRQRKKSAHTPIIFVTGDADEMRTIEGYQHGAVDYMLTPVVPEILRAKIGVFVNLFRMSQQVKLQADERLALAEERARRSAAEAASGRLEFLAQAGAILGRSLDAQETIRELLRLAVPRLADCCAVTAPGSEGTIYEARAVLGEVVIHAREPYELDLPSLAVKALRTYTPPNPAEIPTGPNAGEFNADGVLVVPLIARGQWLGALALCNVAPRGPVTGADRSMAQTIAGRASIALDNARLHTDLQRADRQKNEFLSMLAHELRNPLAPIRNGVEVLRLHSGQTDDLISSTCGIIERQVRHMVRLVDDLLDASRITQGKIVMQPTLVDAASIIQGALELSQPSLDAKRQQLELSLPDKPIWLHADPVRITQVLANLLNNAAKFTEERGRVDLSLAARAGQAEITVRDNGIGISQPMLDRVFDLFAQADVSVDRTEGGLGIGLTLARHLVEMHGGTVQAASPGLGRGAEFTVRLPLDETANVATVDARPSPRSERDAPRMRILVVDDNRDAASSLTMLLRLHGHEVASAHDGRAALTAADDFLPDVVLLDIGLPGLDGYQIARLMREHPRHGRCVLVALTGYGQDDDRRKAMDAGFDDHFTKPVNIDQLFSRLQDLRAKSDAL